ncbi:hypothetical protein DL240_16545 [Lujinxingia litoralis]|uniref:Uncharacterized protein n=1 Tax=Lujinxingia litoralis TaxID=2211119 RepID=A0A328C1W1_9DELT|nr:hypothetical protein [Lujinxingia litoralis]RAL20413.1 hypothetical protein DL240_16545 [Lujinxingia litoralis]
MRLQQGLDVIHRQMEEWAEAAGEVLDSEDVDGLVDLATELLTQIQEIVEELDLDTETLRVPTGQVGIKEVGEGLGIALAQAWELLEFGQRPSELHFDQIEPLLVAFAELLELDPEADEAEEEVERITTMLDEFLSDTF